jgi:hypothetical protein
MRTKQYTPIKGANTKTKYHASASESKLFQAPVLVINAWTPAANKAQQASITMAILARVVCIVARLYSSGFFGEKVWVDWP